MIDLLIFGLLLLGFDNLISKIPKPPPPKLTLEDLKNDPFVKRCYHCREIIYTVGPKSSRCGRCGAVRCPYCRSCLCDYVSPYDA